MPSVCSAAAWTRSRGRSTCWPRARPFVSSDTTAQARHIRPNKVSGERWPGITRTRSCPVRSSCSRHPQPPVRLDHLPEGKEPSQRSRSLLFLAAGLTVAAGYGPDVPLYIPGERLHRHQCAADRCPQGQPQHAHDASSLHRQLSDCVGQLGITNPIVNPFRLMTKGEILAACPDQPTSAAAGGRDALMRASGSGALGEGRTDELRVLLPVPHPARFDASRWARPGGPLHLRCAGG